MLAADKRRQQKEAWGLRLRRKMRPEVVIETRGWACGMASWGTLKQISWQAVQERKRISWPRLPGGRQSTDGTTSWVLLKSSASFEATNRRLSLHIKGILQTQRLHGDSLRYLLIYLQGNSITIRIGNYIESLLLRALASKAHTQREIIFNGFKSHKAKILIKAALTKLAARERGREKQREGEWEREWLSKSRGRTHLRQLEKKLKKEACLLGAISIKLKTRIFQHPLLLFLYFFCSWKSLEFDVTRARQLFQFTCLIRLLIFFIEKPNREIEKNGTPDPICELSKAERSRDTCVRRRNEKTTETERLTSCWLTRRRRQRRQRRQPRRDASSRSRLPGSANQLLAAVNKPWHPHTQGATGECERETTRTPGIHMASTANSWLPDLLTLQRAARRESVALSLPTLSLPLPAFVCVFVCLPVFACGTHARALFMNEKNSHTQTSHTLHTPDAVISFALFIYSQSFSQCSRPRFMSIATELTESLTTS